MNLFMRLLTLAALFAPVAAWAADPDTEIAALETAAALGNPKAQTLLAARYEYAEGVQKDFKKSNKLYCQAAKQGNAEAQFKLGWVYANGRGVPREEGVAGMLFAMAAEHGHERALQLLHYVRRSPDAQLPACMRDESLIALDHTVEASGVSSSREIKELVIALAPEFGVDPQLALAIISVESAFNPAAVSPRNAQGLMQLIPDTSLRFGVKRAFDPMDNVKGGLAYLRWLLAFFQGNVPFAVAAYNAGERAIEKYRGIPPFPETQNYVKKVTALYKRAVHPYEPGIVGPSPLVAGTKITPGQARRSSKTLQTYP